MATDWQSSAVQINGVLKQLEARGLKDAVLSKCSEATRQTYTNPFSARWHPGATTVEFGERFIEHAGKDAYVELMYDVSRAAFGPILRPVVQIALTLTGRTPATLLARIPSSMTTALQHVSCEWKPAGERGGTLSFIYPGDVAWTAEHSWRGLLRFVSELVSTPIRVEATHVTGGRLDFTLAW